MLRACGGEGTIIHIRSRDTWPQHFNSVQSSPDLLMQLTMLLRSSIPPLVSSPIQLPGAQEKSEETAIVSIVIQFIVRTSVMSQKTTIHREGKS
jgi:hypothetical protein